MLAAGLVVLVLGSGGGAVGLTAWRLEGAIVASFRDGQAHLERGRTMVQTANATRDVTLLDRARTEFEAAARDFGDGRRAVGSSQLARLGGRVPLAGAPVRGRVEAVDPLSATGMHLAPPCEPAVVVYSPFLLPSGRSSQGTRRLLEILAQAMGLIDAARDDLNVAAADARAVDPALLPASQRDALLKARTSIQRGVAGLAAFDSFLPVIQDVLAADGRHVYLIEQVNPFELRAGGGYVGTYSLLAADHGALTLLRSGDTNTLPEFDQVRGGARYVAPPPTRVEFVHDKSWHLGDSNFFPDFPTNARAAETFAQRDFGAPVDGVISIDLYAVQGLLTVTGPIDVPGYQLTVTADNLLSQMAKLDILDPNHKKILSALADPLIQRLTAVDPDHWPQLIAVLNQLASGRHLQVFFNNAQDEAEMVTLGLGGELAFANQPDFLSLIDSNYGGNKANYFLTRRLTVQLTRDGQVLHHRLVEDLALDLSAAPASYTVPYQAYLRLLVPSAATARSAASMKAPDYPNADLPAGTALIDGWLAIDPDRGSRKGTRQVVYTWDTPWAPGADGRQTIYVEKQPGTAQDALAVSWTNGGRTTTAAADLGVDRVIQLSPDGVRVVQGQSARAELPRIGV